MLIDSAEKKTMTANSSEINLILCCSQAKLDQQNKTKISELLDRHLDWNYILATCDRHRVMPLFYNNIKQYKYAVPVEVLNKFQDFYHKNTYRNVFVSSKLAEALDAFQSKGIAAISFKGPSLATSAYGNIASRTFGDADILIDPKSITQATYILNNLGYPLPKQITKVAQTPYGKSSIFLESQNQQKSLEIIDEKQIFAIELHWSLFHKYFSLDIPFWDLWENRSEFSLSGKHYAQFSGEDLLVYLCIHGSKHYWSRLQWICDINELIKSNPNLDWQKVQERASKWGCRRMLYLGLILSQSLLDTDLPEEIEQTIKKDRSVHLLAKQVSKRLFDTSEHEFNRYLFLSRCRERNRDKLTYLFKTILTPNEKDWYFRKLPKQLHILYYIIRPYRLLYEYFFKH